MKLIFWGVRGTIAVPGKQTLKYGGNTPCVQVVSSVGDNIILDIGTGSKSVGDFIIKNNITNQLNVLISHAHWDHIQGIPYFLPFYTQNFKINFYAPVYDGMTLEQLIDAQLTHYFFPVQKEEVFKAEITYNKMYPNSNFKIGNIDINTISTFHHGNTLAFKLQSEGKTVVYMTDNELRYNDEAKDEFHQANSRIIDFVMNADYLIHDCTYSAEDYKKHKNWGHSFEDSVLMLSEIANVKNLYLYHYSPDYNDSEIDAILSRMNKNNSNHDLKIFGSYEGLELEII